MTKKKIDVVQEALNAIRAEIHKHTQNMNPSVHRELLEELIADYEGLIEAFDYEEGNDGECYE